MSSNLTMTRNTYFSVCAVVAKPEEPAKAITITPFFVNPIEDFHQAKSTEDFE